ncbi:tetratricopeptide repeat protein [Alteraurantiacibacter buctensis]|uniref:Tetratricopeptide repeat protein n=1 Tax=Alteraurantiacibacter buctensis TaxID=1503981 RepID=A0A844YT95_9SPHN|nr:tetratricopeptide repeat protein [Alteraurantiacibacter buctensis]MXO70769.1 tetratricopeptide repeat protein [Alteraurantiacibacter buctensis]
MGLSLDEQKAVDRFRKAVVEPSQTKLVILDFWAEWCGPCKALTPVLEKVAAEYADRGVVLAKINVDEEGFIASQFQVQSIPTVYAMFQGQPVADLTPARSESQLKGALDQILAQLPVTPGAPGDDSAIDLAQLIAIAEERLAAGEAEQAAAMFHQLTDMAPQDVAVLSGLLRSLVAAGHQTEAQAAFDTLPPEVQNAPELAQVKTTLELAANKVDDGELQSLRAAAAERPADMDAQLAFAEAAFAAGSRDEAAETLLGMIRNDPAWNDGAAKARLLQMFEAVGLEDPWVSGQRRKLSLLLFG